MQDLKFFTLLRTLRNKEELESFHRYLKQMHGNERIALALFGYLRKFYPDYRDDKKLEIAYAYRKVFKSEIGENRKKIHNTLSDLHIWLKDFLISEKTAADSSERKLTWLAILQERGLRTEFSRQSSQLRDEVNAIHRKTPVDYMKAVAVNFFIHCHLERSVLNQEQEEVETDLDLFYALAKIKLACEKANYKNLRPETAEPERLPPDFGSFSPKEMAKHPLLLLYREVYQLIAAKQDNSFDRLENMLPEHADAIDPLELNLILRYLHNYAAAQIRNGMEGYWKRIHHLNKFSLERDSFDLKRVITGAQFNNIVSAACYAKDVAWASAFVRSHTLFLPAEVRDEAALLAEATILFEKKNFNKVLDMLEEKDFRDTSDFIRSKALLIKTYYELDREDILDKCHAFDTFLYRHLKPETEAVKGALNFSKILKSLVRRKMDKTRILEEIRTTKPLYFISWLLEKANEYRKI